mmetsp:Transcript_13320/g.31189  ORF Transcript_13320/g.31189 Transcript_13320/m.31189 type:complete len:112 (+) Transcript_13320:271-606(+)
MRGEASSLGAAVAPWRNCAAALEGKVRALTTAGAGGVTAPGVTTPGVATPGVPVPDLSLMESVVKVVVTPGCVGVIVPDLSRIESAGASTIWGVAAPDRMGMLPTGGGGPD